MIHKISNKKIAFWSPLYIYISIALQVFSDPETLGSYKTASNHRAYRIFLKKIYQGGVSKLFTHLAET